MSSLERMLGATLVAPRFVRGSSFGKSIQEDSTFRREPVIQPELNSDSTLELEYLHSTLKSYILGEVAEWPEVVEIAGKLRRNEEPTEKDMEWIKELAEATGWDADDIADELKNLDADPVTRAERYRRLHEEYFKKAKEFKEKGDKEQASEKLWGAITALVKFYAGVKGAPVVHWSRGKMDKVITKNFEEKFRELFEDLLDKGQVFHEYFYEGIEDEETFEKKWEKTVKLLEDIRRLLFRK
jgi:hypothetical protein